MRVVLCRAGLAALAATLLAGCGAGHFQFRADDRLQFVTPEPRQRVNTPVTVRWTMKEFAAVGLDGSSDRARGAYAVFVDRAPIPAGGELRQLLADECASDPACAVPDALARANVYITTATEVTLTQLPRVGGSGDERHSVNVVLVDGRGQRIGESAWYVPFITKRRAS